MSFAFGPEAGGLEIGQPFYGVYWKKTYEIHRTGMTFEEARDWIEECKDIFPGVTVYDIFGVCTAEWLPVSYEENSGPSRLGGTGAT